MKNNHARVKIPISDSVFVRMKVLYQHGDLQEIANLTGITYRRVQRAWDQRRGEKKLIDAFIKFYDSREGYLKDSKVELKKEVAI